MSNIGKIVSTYYIIKESRVIQVNTLCVHSFSLELEEIDQCHTIIDAWRLTDLGKFVVDHSIEAITINKFNNFEDYCIYVTLLAKLTGEDTTYFLLKLP